MVRMAEEGADLGAGGGGTSPVPLLHASPLVHDPDRLAVLDAYNVLDSVPEEGFDDLVQLAALACETPVALVSLVTGDRQWFKARVNFPACETDLDRSVCKFALAEPDLLVIPDLTADPRTADNPLVTHAPHIRFYAGAPLRTPEGQTLGSLCVIDHAPRPEGLDAVQAEHMRRCARQVMSLLELRRAVVERDAVLTRQNGELRRERHFAVLAEASAALLTASDPARVIEPILSTSAASLGFEQCFIYDIAPGARRLRLTSAIGVSEAMRATLTDIDIDGPLCGLVVRTGRPVVLSHVLASLETRYAMARANGIDAFAGYPIESRGRLVGVISFTAAAQPAFDDGACAFFSTIARYLSAVRERLDGEAALRASDARSRRAQEAGRVGTFELEIASGLVAVSPELCRLYGLAVSPFYSAEAIAARVLPEDADLASNEASREDGSAPLAVEYRIRRADDGAVRWIVREAQAVHDDAGGVVRWFGTVRDATDRHEAQATLRASEAHWRGLFERLSEGFLVGEVIRDATGAIRDWRYIDVNAAWGALVGIDPGTVVDRTIREVIPGIEESWIDEFAAVVETGQPTTFVRRVGSLTRWYEGRAFPLGTERFGVIFLDVTARVEAETRRNGLLEFSEHLRGDIDPKAVVMAGAAIIGRVLGVGRVGYGTVDQRGENLVIEENWSVPGFPVLAERHRLEDYGRYAEDLRRGRTVVIPDVREDPRTTASAAALEAISARSLINLPVIEKGRMVAMLFVNDDHARAWSEAEVGFVRQIAELIRQTVERRRAEDHQDLLNHELSHRLKNTLSIVVSIANQTLRTVPERAPVEAFERRVQALASAHDVLLRRSWTSAPLRTVCEEVLHKVAQPARLDLAGPDVALGPTTALSVSLLLHELATNAAKYGSLSAEAGRVALRWEIEDAAAGPELVLGWRESGGPAVVAPTRRGFGSRLIRMGLVGTGGVAVAYHPDGFEAVMRAPLAEVQRS